MNINFCGDSFCSKGVDFSWTTILANKLGANVLGLGISGIAHEHAIKSFDPSADITIFTWTDYERIYHKEYILNKTRAKKLSSVSEPHRICHEFYEQVHDYDLAKERQMRDMYWFDHAILSNYKGKAFHAYSRSKLYTFKNSIEYPHILTKISDVPYELTGTGDTDIDPNVANHFTKERNAQFAESMYKLISKNI